MNLHDLGRNGPDDPGGIARVIAVHRGHYRVSGEFGERTARITGKLRSSAASREDFPAVGDRVAVTELDGEQAVITAVMPRRTVLRRKEAGGSDVQIIAANVDIAFIVQAVGRDFSVNRIERTAALAAAGGVAVAVVLNKADLVSPEELDSMTAAIRSRLPGVEVIATDTVTASGLDALRFQLEPGKTYCFVGSSGVGKSTIINRLIGADALATGTIGARTNRGKHVTTTRALIVLDNGAMVIDNPGMRELGVLGAESGIGDVFSDIDELARSCKFGDCLHEGEPGCAVRAALEEGKLDASRLENFLKLARENAFHDMTALDRRRKDKAFGKYIKKVLSDLDREVRDDR